MKGARLYALRRWLWLLSFVIGEASIEARRVRRAIDHLEARP